MEIGENQWREREKGFMRKKIEERKWKLQYERILRAAEKSLFIVLTTTEWREREERESLIL